VQKVEPVELAPSGGGAVAIRVTLPDRVDTIISTTDDEPWQTRQTADGKLCIRGRFAHVTARGDATGSWAYLVDGDLLEVDNHKVRTNTSYSGKLTKTYRIEAGDPFDAFVTDVPLPTDGSLDGRTLIVDEGGVLVQAFQIDHIQTLGDETLIHSADEPGMTITPNLLKLEYFPCWGIVGKARFRIAGSTLVCGE